jgi:hypothetical protein
MSIVNPDPCSVGVTDALDGEREFVERQVAGGKAERE